MIVLPRQKRNFTCGIAAMATISQLLGLNFPKGTLLSNVGAKPEVGTENEDIINWALEHMPVHSHGENSYSGGLALANIQNKDSGIGHYVVFLGQKDGRLRYWCPLLGDVFESAEDEIVWKNSTGDVCRWSVNFETEEDFYDIAPTPERHIFLLRCTGEKTVSDSHLTDMIQSAYDARGQSVSVHSPENVLTKGPQLLLDGVPVLKNDVVWLHCSPMQTPDYFELLKRLSNTSVNIINPPEKIMGFHEELRKNNIEIQGGYTASSPEAVKRCFKYLTIEKYTRFLVYVPYSLCAERHVAVVDNLDALLTCFEAFSPVSGYVAIKGVGAEKELGYQCVLATSETTLGELCYDLYDDSVVERKECTLNTTQKAQVGKIQKCMKDNRIFISEIEFVGDDLINVNVAYTNNMHAMSVQKNSHIEYDIIDACQKYIKEQVI